MPPLITISQIAKRFVTGGLEAVLGRKEQVNRHRKIGGRVEAHHSHCLFRSTGGTGAVDPAADSG